MKLDVQKRIAAAVMKCPPNRVCLDGTKLKEIKEAITRADIRGLIIDGFITKKRKNGTSTFHSKAIKAQKKKGKRKGQGSRKGRATARTPRKETWMKAVRLQRKILSYMKDNKEIDNQTYWELYRKIKGGFFRSKRHLQLYITERKLSLAGKKEESEKAAKPKEEKKKAAEKEKTAKPKTEKADKKESAKAKK